MGALVITNLEDIDIISVGEAGPPGADGAQGPPGVGATQLQLEMGETLTKGTPLYVSGNKFYAADNVTNYRIIGLLTEDTDVALLGTAILLGQLSWTGLSVGSPYFLGNGIITTVAPASGYVVRVGQAVTGTILSVNIEEPILLA